MAGLCEGGNEPPGSLKAIYGTCRVVRLLCTWRLQQRTERRNPGPFIVIFKARNLGTCVVCMSKVTGTTYTKLTLQVLRDSRLVGSCVARERSLSDEEDATVQSADWDYIARGTFWVGEKRLSSKWRYRDEISFPFREENGRELASCSLLKNEFSIPPSFLC
ncbi:hypothetical protein ANN_23269 [Periplaneta americana]|uniref:Uncharacterized protein n=1 Tax=Periplaneta americana TaxID=6978 RepID=A0ABQ8SLM9_PERAM|nr:hypothetical protein ANN_23269 [Periplaneta americana]